MVDLNLYPDVPKVEWTYSTLEPGDCIFIPSGKVASFILHEIPLPLMTLDTTNSLVLVLPMVFAFRS